MTKTIKQEKIPVLRLPLHLGLLKKKVNQRKLFRALGSKRNVYGIYNYDASVCPCCGTSDILIKDYSKVNFDELEPFVRKIYEW